MITRGTRRSPPGVSTSREASPPVRNSRPCQALGDPDVGTYQNLGGQVIDHPARARVAEIMVARLGRTGEEHTRGSGYLVSTGWVLTAHHVVKDAVSVGVWLGAPPELALERSEEHTSELQSR